MNSTTDKEFSNNAQPADDNAGRSWWLENLGIEPGPKRSSDALKLETKSDNGLG